MKAHITPNTSIEYDDIGSGQPIVLLHAFPLSRAMWRPQIAALQNDYRVIAPDLRGFGGSSPFDAASGATPSIEKMADDIAALLHTLELNEPVVVGGLSMGGYVALAFARKYADRLRALVLADTRAEADDDAGKAKRDEMIEFARTHSAEDVINQMMPKMLSADAQNQRPHVIEAIRRIAAAQTRDGIISAVQALRDRPNATPHLQSIKVPTLVIVGSEDALTPPQLSETLASNIAGARLEKIPAAGHISNLEQPEAFNDALRLFLRTL